MVEQFLSSLMVVAASEMGDKTQLLVCAFATQCRLSTVMIGVVAGLLTTNLLAAILGLGLGVTLPLAPLKLGAGVIFLVFAGWTLWDASNEDDCGPRTALRSPFAIACAFFMAELGDKTQLATLTLAARYQSFWPVWLGASVGMIVAITVALGFATFIGKRIPERALRLFSAAIFALFGIITIVQALGRFSV